MNIANSVTVKCIPTWPEYFKFSTLTPKSENGKERLYKHNEEINNKVSLWKGDITRLATDCIAIAEKEKDSTKVGGINAISTAAGSLIYASYPYEQNKRLLAHTGLTKCVENCLKSMLSHSNKTIGIPFINPNEYGLVMDTEDVAHVTLRTVRGFISENKEKIDRIVFCFGDDNEFKISEDLMQRYFPVVPFKHFTVDELLKMARNVKPKLKKNLSYFPKLKVTYPKRLFKPKRLSYQRKLFKPRKATKQSREILPGQIE